MTEPKPHRKPGPKSGFPSPLYRQRSVRLPRAVWDAWNLPGFKPALEQLAQSFLGAQSQR